MRRLVRTTHLLTAPVADSAPVEMSFVETTATPALAQLITQSFIDLHGVYSDRLHDKLTPEKVRMLYDRSLFNLLRVETIRQAFVACMKQHFERRLVNFRAGYVPIAYRHLGMDEEVCERKIREWEESRDRFEEETELLAHLDEPLFSTKPHREYGPADSKRWTQMVKAIADFPNYLENLLEVLWTDHCADKETDTLEMIHD